jgi:CheY-like chemotaxis protein
MPGMSGHEVARRLRQEMGERTPRLVALTGWGQDHDRALARAAGFEHHLVKPVDAGELQRLLRTLGRPPAGDART